MKALEIRPAKSLLKLRLGLSLTLSLLREIATSLKAIEAGVARKP